MRLFNFGERCTCRGRCSCGRHEDERVRGDEFLDDETEEFEDDADEEMDDDDMQNDGMELRTARDGRGDREDLRREDSEPLRDGFHEDCRRGGHHHHDGKRVCFTVPRGERGENGARGERGLPGIQGLQGERGLRGERGERGERGLRGERGENGTRGERGLRGERGESVRGEIGPRGERGERGLRGERGPRGERGESGSGANAILPFASGRPIELTTECGDTRGHGALLGFGNAATTPMPLRSAIDISGGPGMNLDFAFCVPHNCHVTSMSAFFSTVLPVDARCGVRIFAELYHNDGHDNVFKPLEGTRLELEPRLCDRNCKTGVSVHARRGDMSVRVREGSRVMMVFYAKSKEVHTVVGYASAGIVIE